MISTEWDVELPKKEKDEIEDLAMILVMKLSLAAIRYCDACDPDRSYEDRLFPKNEYSRTKQGAMCREDHFVEEGTVRDLKFMTYTHIDYCTGAKWYAPMSSLRGRREFELTVIKHGFTPDLRGLVREWSFYSVGVRFENHKPVSSHYNYCMRRSRLERSLSTPDDQSEVVSFKVPLRVKY